MKRSEQFTVGSYVHVYNRGTKKMPIYRQKSDLWQLLFNLYYFNNDSVMPNNWRRDLNSLGNPAQFLWPEQWEKRQPLVSILAFNIMPNHFHILLRELVEGGVSRFMQKMSLSYSKFVNEKYDESGSLFQGPYKSKLVVEDFQFQYLSAYIMVKNSFELYPGGLEKAIREFDKAYDMTTQSPFNSLAEYAGLREFPIITKDLLGDLFPNPVAFKEFAHECMLFKLDQLEAAATFK